MSSEHAARARLIEQASQRLEALAVNMGELFNPRTAAHLLAGCAVNALARHYGRDEVPRYLRTLADAIEHGEQEGQEVDQSPRLDA
jgi:hypothetical protein